MRLKPLLNEADALRAERTSLEAEQNDLVFALKEAGVTLPGLAEVTMPHPNLDQELELRLRTAVEVGGCCCCCCCCCWCCWCCCCWYCCCCCCLVDDNVELVFGLTSPTNVFVPCCCYRCE
ncbi:unnamed protein product [Polarella glacialis]|uniref:Uncharacterized protein n=1 Tax=Polarella glacialis TaxID=89957 RepID=A0A813KKH3_POLGL|nr:unnamed protein product [Polarella glacialis]